MAKKSQVQQLIDSLTPSEKKYFKQYCKIQSGDKAYLRLYDILEKKKSMSFTALEKEFSGKTKLSHYKKHLFQQILTSLRSFNKNHFIQQSEALVSEVILLYQKGLYDLMLNKLNLAKKHLWLHEQYEQLLRLTTIESNYASRFSNANYPKVMSALYKESQKLLNILQQEQSVCVARINLMGVIKQSNLLREQTLNEKLEKDIKNPIIQDIDKLLTTKTQTFALDCWMIYYFGKKNYSKLLETAIKAEELYYAHPHLFKIRASFFIACLINQSISLTQLKRWDKIPLIFDKIEKHHGLSLNADLMAFGYFTSIQITYSKNNETIEKFENLLVTTENKLKKLKFYMSPETMVMHYKDLALGYEYLKKYDLSLEFIEKALNNKKKNLRNDLTNFLPLLKLIVLYKLKKENLNEEADKIYHQLYRRKGLLNMEKELLSFFRRIHFNMGKTKMKKTFLSLQEKITTTLKQNPLEKQLLEYYDFLDWIEMELKKLN